MRVAPATVPRAEPALGQRSAAQLSEALHGLRADVVEQGNELFERWRPRIEREQFAPSALNLARYIALRRHELRQLQLELMPWGLSSLGRCEARVLENLDAVIAALDRIDPLSDHPSGPPNAKEFFRGHDLLRHETEAALGPTPPNRDVRIMVTMPPEAAEHYELIRGLVERGMDVARINCAHDGGDDWRAMSEHVRHAAAETGRPCRVCMDICGPRARTKSVAARDDRRLAVGERLLMGETEDPAERLAHPVEFQCSLPGVIEQIQPGQMVWLDEGSMGAVVERKLERGAVLRITNAPPKGGRVRPDKGLNFPDTELVLDPLTRKDLEDLDVIAEVADIVGYSFVQRPRDIELLQAELGRRRDRPDSIALVTKIETKLGIRNLPELIVQAGGAQPVAVMIARGDLAVEIGYRRLAEVQEELLWLCEAAHVPVIWATQVLDKFVHKGIGARGEITDAAMAERAECVMLNKGPFVGDAVTLLDDMLARMEGHQFKKVSRMRQLHSW